MGKFYIFLGMVLIILFSTSSFALTISPIEKKYILTACPFKLSENLRYDVCLTPVTGADVYYNITYGPAGDPTKLYYPLLPQYKLNEVSPGVYEKIVEKDYLINDYFWKDGSYTASINATKPLYLTYNNKTFYIYPDFPFFYSSFLSGNKAYLNVRWVGSYNITPGSCLPDRPLSIRCYFNGNLVEEIDPNVKYSPRKEYTSTVFSPDYRFCENRVCPGDYPTCLEGDKCSSYASPTNIFFCIVFDPYHPWLNYSSEVKFKPIYFKASYTPPATVTLGEEFKIKIDVTNLGLFVDNYTIEVTSSDSSVVSVIDGYGVIENLAADCPEIKFPATDYNCNPVTKSFEARLIPLIARDAQITITVTSNISGIKLKLPPIPVISYRKSLSEFGWNGILQIMIVAAIVIFLLRKKL